MPHKTRLNKALAMLGVCSRREADRLIVAGEIRINGSVRNELGCEIDDGDLVTVHGIDRCFRASEIISRAWLYYKPAGLIVTHRDNSGRRTIFDDLKTKLGERVISVGRLDLNSEGLLLLTNDGEFARCAESPKTGWERRYRARIFGKIDRSVIEKLRDGMVIDGLRYRPMIVRDCQPKSEYNHGMNRWVDCTIHEGKNREIRKLFGYFGIMVNRLIRYKFGPYELEGMSPGDVKPAEPIGRISNHEAEK
jgi:23S rRNA pseudouridine2605 synthase